MTDRRTFLRLAGLGALGLGAAACSSDSGSGAGSSRTSSSRSSAGSTASSTRTSAGTSAAVVGSGGYGDLALQLSWLKSVEFAGEYFADAKGYYTDAGFGSVDLLTGPVDSIESLVEAGTVDVGLSAPEVTARFIADRHAPLKIIGNTFQKNAFCILSLEEKTPIRTPRGLVGKTLGIQPGPNQAMFDGFLRANNIDPGSLTQQLVQYEPTALTDGTVDGFMASMTDEPFTVEGQGYSPVMLSFADHGLPLTAGTFVVTQDSIDSRRDMLKAFLKAEISGWNDAVADPAAAAALAVNTYGKDLGLDLAGQTEQAIAQNELVATASTTKSGLFTLTGGLIHEIIDAMGDIGIAVTADQLFDLSLLDEVYQANPELIVG